MTSLKSLFMGIEVGSETNKLININFSTVESRQRGREYNK
jgi:hypothetical protein